MINPYSFIGEIAHIPMRDILPQCAFAKTGLSDNYWLDVRHCYRHGKRKNSIQLYEMFAIFSDNDPDNVKPYVLQKVLEDKEKFERVGWHHLKRIGLSIDQWITLMVSDSVFGDELMLFILAYLYNCHVVLFTKKGHWSTVGSDEPLSSGKLLDICDVRLVYVGQHMFAEL